MPPLGENNNTRPTVSALSSIKVLCFKELLKALANWSIADVRTVPNVMFQLRCGTDETDQSIEYQFNWFVDCAETYVHNHRNSFYTYCLEGEYEEKIWKIINDHDGSLTYKFTRSMDNSLSSPKIISGALRHVDSRHHFPGNKMYVDTEQFHSVTPIAGSEDRVPTFLIKSKYSEAVNTFVLGSEPHFDGLNDSMRLATEDERHDFYQKLLQLLKKLHCEL